MLVGGIADWSPFSSDPILPCFHLDRHLLRALLRALGGAHGGVVVPKATGDLARFHWTYVGLLVSKVLFLLAWLRHGTA